MKKILFSFLVVILVSCQDKYTPKPRGFFRIHLPAREYIITENSFPYSFAYPVYSQFVPDERPGAEPYWANIVFGGFKGTLYLSYKPVDGIANLVSYLEDARRFTQKHIPKATAIIEEPYADHQNRVFGVLYQIKGREAASPIQFYVTDSLHHFLRGALYFNVTPNNDSLAPVIDFLEKDIRHIIRTLRWQDSGK